MDPACEVAQLSERLAELAPGLVDRALRLGVVLEALLEEPELEREGDETLLGAVVEVALEPAPLGVARLDHLGTRGAELALGALALRDVGEDDHVADDLARLITNRGGCDLDLDQRSVLPPPHRLEPGVRVARPNAAESRLELRLPLGRHERHAPAEHLFRAHP